MNEQARRKEGASKLVEKKKKERAVDIAQSINIPPAQMQFLHHR